MLTALAVSTSVLALAWGGSSGHDTFSFGRAGGNIAPYTVTISAAGTLSFDGPVHLANPAKRVSPAARTRLDRLVRTTRFFSLPKRTLCPGSLPDFASVFVTVTSGSRHRSVFVRGGCSSRFQTLYEALAAAAGVRP